MTRVPRSRCTDLVPLRREVCPRCGDGMRRETFTELALFRHGGYGANRSTTWAICAAQKCRAVRCVQVIETNPRRLAA